MIEMKHESGPEGGGTAPLVMCDYCREEITDCHGANLLWLDAEPSWQYHVHARCNRSFESAMAQHRGKPYLLFLWLRLDRFLEYVCHNAGYRDLRPTKRADPYPFTVRFPRREAQSE